VQQARAATGSDEQPLVLIVDQFEEILTSHQAHWQQREPFFRQLAQALREDDLLWVVLVMREDYVAALDPYLHLLPDRLRSRFYMQRMDAVAAQEAIEKPALLAGRSYAPGVAGALVDNLRQIRTHQPAPDGPALGEFVEPVQLQVVCYQLWQRLGDRPDGEITMRDLEQLGDVDAALSHFYEQAIAAVRQQTSASEIQLRNWFERQLITEAGTRGTVFFGAAETAGLDNEIVQQLAAQFILRAEMRAGGVWYELVHDRFVAPILQANQAWRAAQDPLIRAAEEWERTGQDKALLLQGQQLQEALAATELDSAEPIVADFLLASQDAQSQRDLAAAREKAAADERRAQEEARRAQRLRRITAVLVLAILFALGGAVWAILQTREARAHQAVADAGRARAEEQSLIANAESTRAVEQRLLADAESTRAIEEEQRARAESTRAAREQVEAEIASTRAIVEKATADAASTRAAAAQQTAEAERDRAGAERAAAEAARADAERQGQLLLAQSLAFAALNVSQLGDDTELATLLALEAGEIHRREQGAPDASATTALLSLLTRPYFNVTLYSHDGEITALVYSSDGERLASGGDDGTIRLWSPDDTLAAPLLLDGHEGAVRALLFAGDQTLISAGDDRTVRFWSLAGDPVVIESVEEAAAVRSIALDPGGRQLITSLDNGSVNLWDLDAPEQGPVLLSPWFEPGYRPLVFQEGEGGLLAGNPSGALHHWPGARISASPSAIGQAGDALTAVAAAAGDSAFGAADGSVRVRRQGGLDLALSAHDGAVNGLALSPGAELLASAGEDGMLRLWEMPDPESATAAPLVTLQGHDGPVRAVAFSPDGQLLVSAGADGTIRLWRLAPALEAVAGGAPSVFSPDGELLATVRQGDAAAPPAVQLWAAGARARPVHTLELPDGLVRSLAFSADGRRLVAAIEAQGAGAIFAWELDAAAPVRSPARWLEQPVRALAIAPDGSLLATAGGADGAIALYALDDLAGARPIMLREHQSAVTQLAFTPGGETLISAPARAGEGDGVRLWSLDGLAGGAAPASRLLGPGGARALAVSPDGARLALAQDGVYLWSLADLAAAPRLLPESVARTAALAFAPDGRSLLAAGDGARLWLLDESGDLPVTFFGGSSDLEGVAVAPDGQVMVVSTATMSYLLPAIEQLPQLACTQLRRNLTWDEWQTYLPGQPYRVTCPDFPPDAEAPAAMQPALSASSAAILLAGGLAVWYQGRRRGAR
jgi:WD40 repeat protein